MADTVGSFLRQKRESLGLTLEKVEGFTHIRVKHLQAIESDDLSAIPSVPQARGFIRNYASFLGITPEEIAGHTGGTRPRTGKPPAVAAAPVNPPQAAPPPVSPAMSDGSARPRAPITAPLVSRSAAYAKPRPAAAKSPGRKWFRLDLILGGAVTLVIVVLLGWGGYQAVISMTAPATLASTEPFIPLSSEAAATASQPAFLTDTGSSPLTGSETAPSGTETATLATDALTPEETPSGPLVIPGTVSIATLSPTPFPTPLGGVYTDVRIHIVVLQRAYLEVAVDGKSAFSGRVLPEETYDFVGQKTVTLSTGNGAAIRVIFNGVDEGAMGRFGEMVSHTYTPTGIVTPIPTVTPTPTVTLTPTRTKNP